MEVSHQVYPGGTPLGPHHTPWPGFLAGALPWEMPPLRGVALCSDLDLAAWGLYGPLVCERGLNWSLCPDIWESEPFCHLIPAPRYHWVKSTGEFRWRDKGIGEWLTVRTFVPSTLPLKPHIRYEELLFHFRDKETEAQEPSITFGPQVLDQNGS